MTTITLSSIKRCYTSPNLKKQHQLSMLINRNRLSLKENLPDLLNDLFIEQQQQRQETIINIATILRKVGDQMDEQLQINHNLSSSSNSQRTITFLHCIIHVLYFFL